jgi:dipeptidyl aminopeptidase/acylaminoacyl peptidase
MHRSLAFASLILLCAILSGRAAETDLAARFAAPPGFRSASISPGGKFIAQVAPVDGVDNVVILPLEPGAKPSRFAIQDSAAVGVLWRDDERLIATLRSLVKFNRASRFYNTAFDRYVLSPTGARPPVALRKNREFVSSGASSIVDLDPNGTNSAYTSSLALFKQMYIGPYVPDYFTYDLLKMNLDNGGFQVAQKGEQNTVRWIMDGEGKVVARIDVASTSEDAIFVPASGGGFQKLGTIKASDGRIVGLTEDGKSLAVMGRREADRLGLYRLSLADGQIGEPLFSNPSGDLRGVLFDERSFRVVGASFDDGTLRFIYSSPERQRLQRDIEGVLPGRTVRLISASADRSKHLVVTSGPQNPPVLQLVDLKAGRIDVVAEAYPQLRGVRLGEVRRLEYATRDGMKLTGLLTLPPGKEPANLPLVVVPSGGFGYSDENFDWFAQFLAQRGYAVLETGARSFKNLGDVASMDELGVWMSGTQEDVASAVRDVVDKRIADPKRVCLAGTGTGGYVAMSGMVFLPDQYACGISLRGFYDIRILLRDARDVSQLAINTFNSTLIRNRREYSDQDLVRFSPALHADRVEAPILLIAGERDFAIDQATLMRSALVSEKKSVELVTIREEAGYFIQPENRTLLLNSIDRFLAAHIGN